MSLIPVADQLPKTLVQKHYFLESSRILMMMLFQVWKKTLCTKPKPQKKKKKKGFALVLLPLACSCSSFFFLLLPPPATASSSSSSPFFS
jgi:hypothetical protein